MEKHALYRGSTPGGQPLIHLIEPGSRYGTEGTDGLKKTASKEHLPQILELIESIAPQPGRLYLLNSALGAGEYVGVNLRGDWFTEAGLTHTPPGWEKIPVWDIDARRKAANTTEAVGGWGNLAWGYPTFYNAHRFRHHCFPAGTDVVMGDRTRKRIEEIEEGELVATRQGPRRVLSLFKREYSGDGVRLELRGVPQDLVATNDHPVLVLRREQVHCRHKYNRLHPLLPQRFANPVGHHICTELREPVGEPQWLPIQEVSIGDYLLLPIPTHGSLSVPVELAELVGWVASEGCLSKDGHQIGFTFSAKNHDDVNSVDQCLHENGHDCGFSLHLVAHGLVCMSVRSAQLHREMSKYVSGKKNTKTLLSTILTWDRESLLRLLGSYIDGDGHVCADGKNDGQLRIRSSSPQMLCMLADIVRALGADCTVNQDTEPGPMVSPTNGETYQGNGSGCVAVAADWAPMLTVYSRKHHIRDTSGKQKRDRRVLPYQGCRLVQVMDAEVLELREEVFNLEVEEVNEYIANEVVVHNCNNDPGRAHGFILGAFWDPRMHRVILVSELVRDLCAQQGALAIYDRIAAGEFVDTSMGAKVPCDECIICGHIAKSPTAYCNHCNGLDPNFGMNKILPDGRVCGVLNHHPRFFDDSFVFVGAEKSAKVMTHFASGPKGKNAYTQQVYPFVPGMKTAAAPISDQQAREEGIFRAAQRFSENESRPAVSLEDKLNKILDGFPASGPKEKAGLRFAADLKVSHDKVKSGKFSLKERDLWEMATREALVGRHALTDQEIDALTAKLERTEGEERPADPFAKHATVKWAEMLKEIPAPAPEQLSILRSQEGCLPSLPKNVLDMFSEDPATAMSAAARFGVVLKPEEFQYALLRKMDPMAADRHWAEGSVFTPKAPDLANEVPNWNALPPVEEIAKRIQEALMPLLAGRSLAPSAIRVRIMLAAPAGDVTPPALKMVDGDPLLEKVSSLYNEYRAGLVATPPDWRSVPVDSPSDFSSWEEDLSRASQAQELSRQLLCLAHWPVFQLG